MHCKNEVYVPSLNDRNAKVRASAYFKEKENLKEKENKMSNCVRETLCTHCIHREVCSIKMTYLDTLNKLPCVNSDFTATLSCKHYSGEAPDPRTNTFIYSDSTSNLCNSNRF